MVAELIARHRTVADSASISATVLGPGVAQVFAKAYQEERVLSVESSEHPVLHHLGYSGVDPGRRTGGQGLGRREG